MCASALRICLSSSLAATLGNKINTIEDKAIQGQALRMKVVSLSFQI
jgi:hypothetical protein